MILCPVCKVKSYLIWRERQYRVYRCKNCKVAFLYPLPEDTSFIYNDAYFKNWYIKYHSERKNYIKKLFSIIERDIELKGKLLDVGCGTGILLEVAKEKGCEVYGQDISPFAVTHCRNKGFDVYDKPLPELNLPENSFDIITMFDVIAHFKDPVSYIKTVAKILKQGGYLIIKTPYHSPLLFFLSNLLSFTGKSRALLHIPAQIFHFNYQSLNLLLSNNNLKLINSIIIDDFSLLDKPIFLRIISGKSLITMWQKL